MSKTQKSKKNGGHGGMVIDFRTLPDALETGLGEKVSTPTGGSPVGTTRSILKGRARAATQKALYVTISTETFKRLNVFIVTNADEDKKKFNKSTVTEQALIEFLDREEAKR